MSNVLPRSKQVAVIRSLVEGSSIRSTSRMTDVSIPTVLSLVACVGEGCADVLDGTMRNLSCDLIECDEIWGLRRQEAAPRQGDGRRLARRGPVGLRRLRSRLEAHSRAPRRQARRGDDGRLRGGPRLAVDGARDDLDRRPQALRGGDRERVRLRGGLRSGHQVLRGGSHGPWQVFAAQSHEHREARVVSGSPDPFVLSTSGVERQNATMRQSIRRLTRLTHASRRSSAITRRRSACTSPTTTSAGFTARSARLRGWPLASPRRSGASTSFGRRARRGVPVKRAEEKRGSGRSPFPDGVARRRMFVLRSDAERATLQEAASAPGHTPRPIGRGRPCLRRRSPTRAHRERP